MKCFGIWSLYILPKCILIFVTLKDTHAWIIYYERSILDNTLALPAPNCDFLFYKSADNISEVNDFITCFQKLKSERKVALQ